MTIHTYEKSARILNQTDFLDVLPRVLKEINKCLNSITGPFDIREVDYVIVREETGAIVFTARRRVDDKDVLDSYKELEQRTKDRKNKEGI